MRPSREMLRILSRTAAKRRALVGFSDPAGGSCARVENAAHSLPYRSQRRRRSSVFLTRPATSSVLGETGFLLSIAGPADFAALSRGADLCCFRWGESDAGTRPRGLVVDAPQYPTYRVYRTFDNIGGRSGRSVLGF